MAIHQLFESEGFTETFDRADVGSSLKCGKNGLFSTVITRFCFLLLLIADSAWLTFNLILLPVVTIGTLLTGGKNLFFKKKLNKSLLNIRRSLACGLALFVGLFCPPFGIMVACTYFLMYDKSGMEEVVPSSLQAQFKEIFHQDQ